MFISYSIKNKLNNKGKEMYELVLNKDGTQAYWARKSVASDPSLMRENQVVESVRKIDDIIDANLVEPELVYQESNKYIYLYNGDKCTIYSPNQVTAEKRIKEKIKKEYGI